MEQRLASAAPQLSVLGRRPADLTRPPSVRPLATRRDGLFAGIRKIDSNRTRLPSARVTENPSRVTSLPPTVVSPPALPNLHRINPCKYCHKTGLDCLVPDNDRTGQCIDCIRLKRECSPGPVLRAPILGAPMLFDDSYYCTVENCHRSVRDNGFLTLDDLQRHEKSVHRLDVSRDLYQCASEICRNRGKIWPRLDDFKQHITRMHKGEDEQDLIRRSVYERQEPFTYVTDIQTVPFEEAAAALGLFTRSAFSSEVETPFASSDIDDKDINTQSQLPKTSYPDTSIDESPSSPNRIVSNTANYTGSCLNMHYTISQDATKNQTEEFQQRLARFCRQRYVLHRR